MINQHLLDYIKQQTALGKSKEEIKQALAQTGWQQADIDEGLKAVESGQSAPAAAAPAALPGGELPSPVEILKQTWEIYKKRLGVLLGVYLIPYLIIVVLAAILAALGAAGAITGVPAAFGLPFIIILSLVLVLAMIYVGVWSGAAMIFAVKDSAEKISAIEAYKRARGKVGAFFVVSLLTALAVMGGMILLIIPGLIFAVWFSQSSYVTVLEGVSGTAALSKSKQYIAGRFWPIAGRLLFMLIITILVSIFAGAIGRGLFGSADSAPKSLFTGIINLFLVPLAAIYSYLLYTYIKSTAK